MHIYNQFRIDRQIERAQAVATGSGHQCFGILSCCGVVFPLEGIGLSFADSGIYRVGFLLVKTDNDMARRITAVLVFLVECIDGVLGYLHPCRQCVTFAHTFVYMGVVACTQVGEFYLYQGGVLADAIAHRGNGFGGELAARSGIFVCERACRRMYERITVTKVPNHILYRFF